MEKSPSRLLRRFWDRLTEPDASIEEPTLHRQMQLLASLLVVMIPLALLNALLFALSNPSALTASLWRTPDFYVLVGLGALLSIAYGLNRAGHSRLATLLTAGAISFGVFVVTIARLESTDPDYGSSAVSVLAYLVLPILVSGLLLPTPITAIVVALNTVGMLLLPLFFAPVTYDVIVTGPLSFIVAVSILTLLTIHYHTRLEAQRQANLAETQERYRSLLETTFEGIIVVENNKLLDANPGFMGMFGYPLPQVVGMSILDFIATDARKQIARSLEIGIEQPLETLGIKQDGTEFHIEIVSKAASYRQRLVRVVAVRDITERVQAEEALRRRTRDLDLLNRAGRVLGSTLDLDQVLLAVLDEACLLLGAVAGSVWLIDPETDELICRQAVGPQSDTVRGWRLAPGEGLAGWVTRNGKSLIVPDVRADPRHFRNIDQQIGLELRAILSAPLRVRQDVIGALHVADTEVGRFDDADLALIESLAITAAIAIENARLFTQEEQRAAELARALEQQQELDRLKNALIQNVSHELRTPLAIARGHAELLEDHALGELQPQQQKSVCIIAHRARVLSRLTDDIAAILDVEMRNLRREPVDVAKLLRTSLDSFRVTIEQAGLTLTTQVAPDLPPAVGDPTHLQRVVNNLLGNASKFTPAGGKVAVHLCQDGPQLVLQVADTGIGIPHDQFERIFERFYQVDGSTSRRYGGTGLGLALVKEIVEIHGGTVNVESPSVIFEKSSPPGREGDPLPGPGSTFTVTLPIFSEE